MNTATNGNQNTETTSAQADPFDYCLLLAVVGAGYVGLVAGSTSLVGRVYETFGEAYQMPVLITVIAAVLVAAYQPYRHADNPARTASFYALTAVAIGAIVALGSDLFMPSTIEDARITAMSYCAAGVITAMYSPALEWVVEGKRGGRIVPIAIAIVTVTGLVAVIITGLFAIWLTRILSVTSTFVVVYLAKEGKRTTAGLVHWGAALAACYFATFIALLIV